MRFGPASTSSTTTTASRIRGRCAAATRSRRWRHFLAGVYNNAGFTQTFGVTEVSQTNPNIGVYVQDEWKVGPRVTLNLGCATTCSSSRRSTPTRTTCRRASGVAWSPFDRAARSSAAAPVCSTIASRCAPLANALLSAGNTTDLAKLRQIGVSLSPTQAGAPVFPDILAAVVPSVTLLNLTTMDRHLQNAYSRQASVEIEQQLGDRATVSVGYQYLRGLHLLMSVNQNVPTCVASGTNNGCRPEPGLREQQPVFVGRRVEVPRPARVVRAAAGAMGPVSRVVHAVEIDEQRRRVLLQLADRSVRPLEGLGPLGRRPAAPAGDQRDRPLADGTGDDDWERLSHGFQVSGMLQAYSALPFNITSGVTTIQGTPGRPIVNGAVHRAQRRDRQRLLQR